MVPHSRFWYATGTGVILFLVGVALFFFYPSDVHAPLIAGATASSSIVLVENVSEVTTASSTAQRLSLFVAGDIMLDRSVLLKTQAAKDFRHPFLLIDPVMSKYDLKLANLEGPITTFTSIANGTGGARLTFTFSPEFLEPLKQRFDILSLANNHTANFGKKGLDQTREFLETIGIAHFGDPNNTPGFLSVTTTHNGISLGLVGYHQLVQHGFGDVLAEVRQLAPLVDILIVMPHWGEEYIEDQPTTRQTAEAHQLIDAGATMVIGAHPHVVQPIEIYKDKVIFYSLGNFIFDQYFSEETMTGLALGIQFEKRKEDLETNFSLLPLTITTQSQPTLASAEQAKSLLTRLALQSKLSGVLPADIQAGQFALIK